MDYAECRITIDELYQIGTKKKTIVFYGSGMGFEVKTYFGGLHGEQTNY